MINFIKTTIIGGLIFLVPVVVVIAVAGKAFKVMLVVAKPLGAIMPVETIGGVALVNLLAILGIALVCFIAGAMAKSTVAKKAYRSLDNALLAIPGYAFVKGMTDGIKNNEEEAKSLVPILVRFDDNAQIGFEVERLTNGQVVVFLPGAPNPWSGSVVYFSEDLVKRLDLSVSQAITNIRRLGRGASQFKEQL